MTVVFRQPVDHNLNTTDYFSSKFRFCSFIVFRSNIFSMALYKINDAVVRDAKCI